MPIFSKGYADSDWCLKEITKIVECGRLIIPVFFHVEPKEVRHQTGPFESAFKRYHASQEMDTEQVNKWSDALTKAGKISVYDLAETKGDEAELIRRIVKRVLTEVNKTRLFATKHPVGLDSRIADVMRVLDIESHGDARIVGIYAMGGMGKTTLAKVVYNQISSHFQSCSFLSNIREAAKQSSGLVSLQKQLLRDIFQDEHVNINSSDEGIGTIQKRIGAKKVLLVLDDVDDQAQLDALAGSLDWFCSGSRIIITTRDKGALREQEMNLYELKKLDDAQSLQLFSWHAFGKEKPDAKFAELSNEVASIASGLPLALKVFGPLFLGFETDEKWATMLARLKAAQHPSQRKDIYEKLKISYDVLCEEEKKVFLDIACFFIGQGRENAALMWEACDLYPVSTIDVLIRKCLVSINDDNGEFEMHDQIRDMGRKIVKDESPNSKPEMRSRLWKTDETLDVLQNKTGTKNVEAIQLCSIRYEELFGEPLDMYVEAESFVAMSELRMLRLGKHVHLKGEFEHFPKKLRWLQWCIKGHMDSLPDGLHLENIVVLDLSDSLITQLWNPQGLESTKVFGKMKVLNLACCSNLTSCSNFERTPHLKKLALTGTKISELHPSIGLLKSLTHLDLVNCHLLMQVPQEFWQLTSLEELDLQGCHQITTLPSPMEDPESLKHMLLGKLKVLNFKGCYNLTICSDFTCMPHLEKLNFAGCGRMSELHPSIGLLKSLTHLSLEECTSLKQVPQEIWQLTSLEELDLKGCHQITTLPSQMEDLGSLKHVFLDNLKVLNFEFCSNLTVCPDFTSMPHLQKLNFSGCEKMSELDPSIGLLKSLTHLSLRCCQLLKRVPQEIWQLTSLEELDLYFCSEITAFPSQMEDPKSFNQVFLGKLKVLDFSYCSNLTICPDFTSMPHLQNLNFSHCEKMSELHPSIGLLESLIDLNLCDCQSLKELPLKNWQLTSLEKFDLMNCAKITTLPSQLGNSKSLAFLSLRNCKSLMELPEDVYQLTSLKVLSLIGCDQLEIIKDVSRLKGLQKLYLSFCKRHVNVLGIQDLHKLEELELQNCENLIRCPLFSSNMTHLRRLNFRDCAKMTELDPSIGHLKNLTDLILWDCKSLKELPQEVSQLTSLITLDLTGCYQISALPESMRHLKQLEGLILRRCQRFAFLPNWIEELKSLTSLNLSWTAIEELPHSIVSLENLEELSVSHCYRLKSLPWFPPSLTTPEARGCGKLEDVPGIKQMKLLGTLELGGCRSLHDSFLERLQEANLQNLEDFSISGRRMIDGGSSYPVSLSFLLPKQFKSGILYLHVDKSSLDNICSELNEWEDESLKSEEDRNMDSNDSELAYKSIPSDEVMDSRPGRVVLIEITTGDVKFQFSALTKIKSHGTGENGEFRKLPTATFGCDSELMEMVETGRFKGNGDAQQRTMMTMRVSIDGCVLLQGDLFTFTSDWMVWLGPDPIELDGNFVVEFG